MKQIYLEAIEEAKRELKVVEPICEGLHDYVRVNVKDITRPHVNQMLTKFMAVVSALESFIEAGNILIGTEIPSPATVAAVVMEDLDDQIATMTAAKAQFKVVSEATKVKMTFGTPQP